jgi:hypothetical protein
MPGHAPAPAGRRIALIAHDNKKQDMPQWAGYNLDLPAGHELSATATTGHPLQQPGLPVTCFRNGPYGGDQQTGARTAEERDRVAGRAFGEQPDQGRSAGCQGLRQGRVELLRADVRQHAGVEVRPDDLLGQGKIGQSAEEPGQLPAHRSIRNGRGDERPRGHGRRGGPALPGAARRTSAPGHGNSEHPAEPGTQDPPGRRPPGQPPGPAMRQAARRATRRRLRSQNQFISSRPPHSGPGATHYKQERARAALTRDYGRDCVSPHVGRVRVMPSRLPLLAASSSMMPVCTPPNVRTSASAVPASPRHGRNPLTNETGSAVTGNPGTPCFEHRAISRPPQDPMATHTRTTRRGVRTRHTQIRRGYQFRREFSLTEGAARGTRGRLGPRGPPHR